ncbi:hypothetical protein JAAARDRAFT_400400 [Jaapia argillacea MUCL 33604]|uniref:Uncharacterized protein n=1 Tax=Jaapia argillacea MUCL 33604 TaxID=933084 RepID=A0A067PTL9_9AGAM|nr:hypothetical protein JAAARDRAFT_400400 [Jaapia argillacea MUCL 33604]
MPRVEEIHQGDLVDLTYRPKDLVLAHIIAYAQIQLLRRVNFMITTLLAYRILTNAAISTPEPCVAITVAHDTSLHALASFESEPAHIFQHIVRIPPFGAERAPVCPLLQDLTISTPDLWTTI